MPGLQQSFSLQQTQVLAPQLQQGLQILQANSLELQSLVQQEMASNPVLEEEIAPPSEDAPPKEDAFEEEFAHLSKLDEEWREYMAQSASYAPRSEEEDDRRQFLFDSLTAPETLQQHLAQQVRSADLPRHKAEIAAALIGNMDDDGFLRETPEELTYSIAGTVEEIKEVLEVVRAFDPVGVGARDLRDCLLLQLRAQGQVGTLEYRIVETYLEDLAKKRFSDIARRLGASLEQVHAAATSITTLEPRPGRSFSASAQSYVIPDVLVQKIDDVYTVVLNNDQIPHLRISNVYKDMMAEGGENHANVKEYIREKIRNGKFFIKSIHQRQQTIFNIATEIVLRQREFLDFGSAHLKPLTMAQVADAVGVHETTVSRAVSAKYMATPHGVFELKYFFTSGYQTSEGESMSNTSVKQVLSDLVKNESPRKPLSDQEMVAILTERGIPIARRTVAKYRAELNILPSNMRRGY